MPKFVAIDADRREVRVVVLERGATGMQLQKVHAVPTEGPVNTSGAMAKLGHGLFGQPLGKARTAVAIGRDRIQLKLMELPPAPPDELTEMVRFQAERELGSPAAGTALDYFPLSGSAQESYRVIAAAMPGDALERTRKLGKAMASDPAHVTLRAVSAVSLLKRWSEFDTQQVSLLAIPLADHAELVVVADGKPVVMRTVRLPIDDEPSQHDAAAQGPATDASLQGLMAAGLSRRDATMASEIRRTIAASHQQLRDRAVGVVYLCGSESHRLLTAGLLGRQLRLPCRTFDPLVVADAEGVAGADAAQLTDPGRFAPAFGLALDLAEEERPVLDFLHPRRPAEKAKIERVHILAAAAALVIVGLFGWWLYDQLAGTSAELAELRRETEERQQIVDQLADVEAQAGEIEAWLATDVNWLDEMERLSRQWRPQPLDAEEFPSQTDAVMTLLTLKSGSGSTKELGQMTITAAGRSESIVPPLERRLRDQTHRVTNRVIEPDEAVPGYPARFEIDIDILPEEEEGGTSG